jgi:Flp pilus assembly protein TadB
VAKDEVTPRRLDKDTDRRLRALDRSAHAPVKKAAKKATPKRGQQGSLGRGIAFVITGIGLFLFGLVNAGHHPDMRVVIAAAIVGVVVLLIGTGFGRYRRHNQADAAATAEVEGRILPNTSTDHFQDGV